MAILTFDQPLFWKASRIVDSEKEDPDIKAAIIRIGRLHLKMSFLGSIGHLMAGTGLKDLLTCGRHWKCQNQIFVVDWQQMFIKKSEFWKIVCGGLYKLQMLI